MAYNRQSIYLRWIGHFGNSLDGWSVGLRLAVVGGGPITTEDYTGFLNTISTAAQAFHVNTSHYVGFGCYLDKLTAAHIGEDGKYVSKHTLTTEYVYGAPVNATGTQTMPWSTAHVISLRTLNARGPASNGRWYYPMLAATTDPATGRLQSGATANRVNGAKTLFDAINAAAVALQPGLQIHVMSSVGPGTSARVVSLRADRRIDAIERRENDQAPNWSTATLADA